MRHLACFGAALILAQLSCDGRSAPGLDAAGDTSHQPDVAVGDGHTTKDLPPSTDAVLNHSLFAALKVEKFFADCMPSVPPDPIALTAHVEFLNNGTIAVGPIQFTRATILWPTGGVVATFDVQPIAAYVIKPGEALSPAVQKVPGTLKPAVACSMCGTSVRIELPFTGAGLPVGSKVTADVTLSCAY